MATKTPLNPWFVKMPEKSSASCGECWGERREDTDDIVQEIFLKAYIALPRFRGDARFSTWVYRIAVNHCRDYLKRGAPLPLELDEEKIADEPAPEDAELQDELRRMQEKRASE